MPKFLEQLRIAQAQISPIIQSSEEAIARLYTSQRMSEPSGVYERVNTRLFTNDVAVKRVDLAIDIPGHMEQLQAYVNGQLREGENKWELVNAHGIATEFTRDGDEVYHWYEGLMLTREVAREDTTQRRRVGREYFFVGRFTNEVSRGRAQQLSIPKNPRVFESLSPSELVMTSGISWKQDVRGYNEPTIYGSDFTPNSPTFHVITIPDGETLDTLRGINQATALFETELAEQAARQIPRFSTFSLASSF